MHRCWASAVMCTAALMRPQEAAAEEHVLTLDAALAFARERAPAARAARARIAEARGRLVGASVLLRDNPVVEGAAGPRWLDGERSSDFEIGVRQDFEPGGRRTARIAAAEADVSAESAASEATVRRLLAEVSAAFLRALHGTERAKLAADAEAFAADLARIAGRRQAVGEAAALDVNLARAALARARADAREATADKEAAIGALRVQLGVDPHAALTLRGDLRDRRHHELPALLARAPERADLRVLAAEIRRAQAEREVARRQAWPDVGVAVRYRREEGRQDVVLGGLEVSLPVFDRGQGAVAEAGARERRARLELESAGRAAGVEVRAALASYRLRVEAVETLERDALPVLADSEALARRGYEAGQIGAADLLTIRRELLDARRGYLDHLLRAALAGVELELTAGVLR